MLAMAIAATAAVKVPATEAIFSACAPATLTEGATGVVAVEEGGAGEAGRGAVGS